MLLLYILWDDWPILRISGSNEQLQHQLEYILLKPDCHRWCISKMQSLEERYAIKFCFKLRKMPQKRMEGFRLPLDYLTWIEHQFLSVIRDSRKAGNLWGVMTSVGGVRKSIHQSWMAKGLGLRLGLRCWGFEGVQEEIPWEETSTLKIGSGISTKTMHQSSTRSLSQTIWPRWESRQLVILPRVQTLLPVTFGYCLSSEAVVMRQLRGWRRLWRRSLTPSHKRTSKCQYEKSLETYRMALVYIYIPVILFKNFSRMRLCLVGYLSIETASDDWRKSPAIAARELDWLIPRASGDHLAWSFGVILIGPEAFFCPPVVSGPGPTEKTGHTLCGAWEIAIYIYIYIYIYMYICVCVYVLLSNAKSWIRHQVFFKRSTTGLNLVFSAHRTVGMIRLTSNV